MNTLSYFKPIKNEELINNFISNLTQITDWNTVKSGDLLFCNQSQLIVHVDIFKEVFLDDSYTKNGILSIKYTSSIDNRNYVSSIEDKERKWYYWDKDLAIELLKDTKDSLGRTLLMTSIIEDDFDTTEKLLKSGVDINQLDNQQVPALFYAAQIHQLPLIKLLIDSGATFNGIDNFEQNIIHFVCHSIKNSNEDRAVEIINYLFKLGVSIDLKDDESMTPLIVACNNQDTPKVLTTLLDKGTDINSTDDANYTAVAYAIENNFLSSLKTLIKREADLNIVNYEAVHPMTLLKSHEACEIIEEKMNELTQKGKDIFLSKRLALLFKE